jgi:hypothetical protein
VAENDPVLCCNRLTASSLSSAPLASSPFSSSMSSPYSARDSSRESNALALQCDQYANEARRLGTDRAADVAKEFDKIKAQLASCRLW